MLSIKFLKSGRFGWAGLTLLLATIKPHLTYLILLLILVWSVRYGHWRVLGGMVIAVTTTGVIMWAIVPGWILSYVRLIMSLPYSDLPASTLDGFARLVFGFHGFRFAGLLLAPLAVFPLLRLIQERGWLTAMNVALLISVPLAPYGYVFDQVVLLPAIVQIVAWLRQSRLADRWVWIVGSGLIVMDLVLFWMLTSPSLLLLSHIWFVWFPFALLGLYMLAWRRLSRRGEPSQ